MYKGSGQVKQAYGTIARLIEKITDYCMCEGVGGKIVFNISLKPPPKFAYTHGNFETF